MINPNPITPRESQQSPITLLLDQAHHGDSASAHEVWRQLHSEIHRIAQSLARGERAGSTIQASVLVNEAYLRLFGGTTPQWEDRNHFLNTVARSMGNFLIDYARARRADKRGGGNRSSPLTVEAGELVDHHVAYTDGAAEALAALDLLEQESPEAAQVARLRFLLGLNVEQTAETMGIATRTVKNKWAYAKAWLRSHLEKPAK